MTLGFPNPSRSFDATVNCVRFCGHDSAIEVSFFIEVDALAKLQPKLVQQEANILDAFDDEIGKIHAAASKMYGKSSRKYVFTLSADNF